MIPETNAGRTLFLSESVWTLHVLGTGSKMAAQYSQRKLAEGLTPRPPTPLDLRAPAREAPRPQADGTEYPKRGPHRTGRGPAQGGHTHGSR